MCPSLDGRKSKVLDLFTASRSLKGLICSVHEEQRCKLSELIVAVI